MSALTSNRGFMLMDTMIAITIFAILTTGLIAFMQMGTDTTLRNAAASQLTLVSDGAAKFASGNYAFFQTNIPVGGSIIAEIADLRGDAGSPIRVAFPGPPGPAGLQNSSYLSANIQLTNDKNMFGQRYLVVISQPAAGDLRVVTLTYGGRGTTLDGTSKFAGKEAPAIAGLVGAAGGFVPDATTVSGAADATTIHGAFGTWRLPLAEFPPAHPSEPAAVLQPGNLAVLSYFTKGQMADQYLHRYSNGNVELNTMRTSLQMGNNDVTGANRVTAQTMVAFQSLSSTRISASGRISTNEYLKLGGIAVAGDPCTDDGLIGRTADNTITICKGGVWSGTNSATAGAVTMLPTPIDVITLPGDPHNWNVWVRKDTPPEVPDDATHLYVRAYAAHAFSNSVTAIWMSTTSNPIIDVFSPKTASLVLRVDSDDGRSADTGSQLVPYDVMNRSFYYHFTPGAIMHWHFQIIGYLKSA